MNLEHVTAFTAAMQRKDLETMLSHMAGDVVLNTPLMAEPVLGKEAIREIVGPLLGSGRCVRLQGNHAGTGNMFLRFLRLPSGQSRWTVWIIGSSIVLG